jgi:1,4-dihydroxy-2-naphthoate octaprenyltransferase
VPKVYEIAVVPADTPVTTPVIIPTMATAVLLLLQSPPIVVVLRVIVAPSHTVDSPESAAGDRFTVTIAMAEHPAADVYDIMAVPAATPVTTPVAAPTVAILVAPLLHVPPVVRSLSVVLAPAQTTRVPVIADGAALTVTSRVA